MAKKSNVFLTTYNRKHKPCGYWSVDEMNRFLEQIKNTTIPSESCVLFIYAKIEQTVQLGAFQHKNTDDNLNISICPMAQKCKVIYMENCPQQIAAGKCRDDFVINLIGKTLFADKYQK